ncbi:MAG: Gfo/Idh/MocA family oxidoreductase [Verrucomicrobia bacterium]|nr:Gfo/Idh/MocA family oxidoreductase [Verrucomicrobiota bacterium]
MPLRLGLIGLGNIGRHHATYLLEGRVPRCELTAVCATTESKLVPYREQGLAGYTDAEALIRSGTVNAVLIATPHYQHTALGIAALEAGLHVMVEKPISAHKADAERLLACAARHPKQILAGMFQQRVEPRYAKIRDLLERGELGRLQRVTWINTDWFRTETYYASGGWRATWKGEGGGVLLNQCLHNLDVLTWLLGMPARVRGFCRMGQWHAIEVEDQVTAYLEYADGASGVFLSSTGEAPGTNRLEIAGSRGRLVLENQRLVLTRNATDALEWSRTATVGFSKPETTDEQIPFDNAAAPHAALMENFTAAVLDGAPLIAPGSDGLRSVELANAIVHSSLLEATVDLPLDGAAWERQLGDLIAASRHRKEVRAVTPDDFAASFRR